MIPERPSVTEPAPAVHAVPRWQLLLVQLAGALPGGLAGLAIGLGSGLGLAATTLLAALGAGLGTVAAGRPTRTGERARVGRCPLAAADAHGPSRPKAG